MIDINNHQQSPLTLEPALRPLPEAMMPPPSSVHRLALPKRGREGVYNGALATLHWAGATDVAPTQGDDTDRLADAATATPAATITSEGVTPQILHIFEKGEKWLILHFVGI